MTTSIPTIEVQNDGSVKLTEQSVFNNVAELEAHATNLQNELLRDQVTLTILQSRFSLKNQKTQAILSFLNAQ